MANITKLTDTLWTGGDLPHGDLAIAHLKDWRSARIRTVIDCRLEWTDEEVVAAVAPDIRYHHVGIDDAGQRIPAAWFDTVHAAANSTPPGEAVLVHCHMGINRGPSAAFALLLADGHQPADAMNLIRTRRPIAAVGYAEDALHWWHQRNGLDTTHRHHDRDELSRWRLAHPHNTVRMIRSIRSREMSE